MTRRRVFITGGTGYLGRALIPLLLERGHEVRALVRRGSESKLPRGCEPVAGDPPDPSSFAQPGAPAHNIAHTVRPAGGRRPPPRRPRQSREISLVSGRASVEAARASGVHHFVYVSVAQPAPVMKAYQEVRAEVEAALKDAGLPATVLRPWYVLGPGHRWPYLLKPFYYVCERLPPTRESAQRLGFVTHAQMTAELLRAVEDPAPDFRLLTVPDIRTSA